MPLLVKISAALALLIVATTGWFYSNARADPVVRRITLHLPGLQPGQAPVEVVLLSDIHIGNAAMDGARLTRIVAQVNALKPDLILVAGDFVFGHDRAAAVPMAAALVRPLSGLRATFGTVAVLGNHDHWTATPQIRDALRRADITLLENAAVARGPLAVAGVDDLFSGHADLPKTLAALTRIKGAPLMLTHSPDLATQLPPTIPLLLAGHTHCGQIVLPLIGPPSVVADHRYLCGVVRDGARTTIVTGGLGASGISLRYAAPPDLWLITLVR